MLHWSESIVQALAYDVLELFVLVLTSRASYDFTEEWEVALTRFLFFHSLYYLERTLFSLHGAFDSAEKCPKSNLLTKDVYLSTRHLCEFALPRAVIFVKSLVPALSRLF